jgi:hypothetical protein
MTWPFTRNCDMCESEFQMGAGRYEGTFIETHMSTNAGKDVHVRVRRVDNAEVTMIRTYAAHERISVLRHSLPND